MPNRAPVMSAEAGQCVSFALKRMRRTAVRKGESGKSDGYVMSNHLSAGMVIVNKTETPPRGKIAAIFLNFFLEIRFNLRDVAKLFADLKGQF